ncbi:M61 family metallopeptidase [Salinimonas sp. HHU 13199]|uniref:M61 family metallopeptidase n=1 Tax=Salinimonas profundi TaxID=2729140 RepID=A0ABR8LHU6_9ALTE|nr:PDZ domain-containing protein [Salinimonas profundi]MBD3584546.1 M61 family metallopeptidase [Salinimonas profundi]
MTTSIAQPHYELSVASKQKHIFSVTLHVPASEQDTITLTLPAWIPGSYMIRDFARHILSIDAHTASGEPRKIEKRNKQTWVIDSQKQAITVSYDVFAFDLSVRSAFINDQYAFCNGTSVFLQVTGMEDRPQDLTIHQPDESDWLLETTMPAYDNRYQASDYAELIDHPVFIGKALTKSFIVNGVEFVVLFSGQDPIDIDRICNDLVPVCEHHLSLFGEPSPVDRYVFMTLLSNEGFGGLEHRSSTALLFPRFELPLVGESATHSDGYTTFLSLCSHELFHTWHVKRIKPEVLVAPDMGKEAFTNQLWIYEGFTSFYDDLTLARTGLITPEKYLEIVGQNITRLLQSGGRHRQSAAESSFDAWTRFYKQDANSANHIVSYYTKGGIIAMGLDLLLRRQSDGKYSLDDVMRLLWERYGKEVSGTPDDVIRTLCKHELDIDVSEYLDSVVYGTDDVALETWLDDIGIQIKYRPKQGLSDKGGTPSKNTVSRFQFGANIKNAATGVTVVQVMDASPASNAGIQTNDTIIAVNDYIASETLLPRVISASENDSVKLTVAREGRLLTLTMALEPLTDDACYFVIEDKEKLQRWLNTQR